MIQERSGLGRKSSVTEKRFDVSIEAVYKVLTKQLNMSKVHNGDSFEKK